MGGSTRRWSSRTGTWANKKTAKGKDVLVLRVATDEKNATYWHRVILWEGLARKHSPLLRKGQTVEVEGPVHPRSYKDGGATRWITETVARKFEIVAPPKPHRPDSITTALEDNTDEFGPPLDEEAEDTEFAAEFDLD
jgi:single-stranded DNA-binding protein